ncbi:MAG: helicase C-terminal domain-containing protein [bacterium]
MSSTYVALGLLTSGRDVNFDSVLEIAALKLNGSRVIDSFSARVKPQTSFARLKLDMENRSYDDGEELGDVLSRLREFSEDADFITADPTVMLFLNRDDRQRFRNRFLDLGDLARILLPRNRRFDSGGIFSSFGIPSPESAQDGAEAVVRAWEALREEAGKLDPFILREINKLVEFTNWEYKELFREAEKEAMRRVFQREGAVDLAGFVSRLRIPELPETPPPTAEESGEKIRLDYGVLEDIFSPNGALSEALEGYEYRQEQVDMSLAVAEAFNTDSFLMVEAGTGTGKTLAYLIPAIFYAVSNGEHIIVSTNTINLQEQLYYKDIPLLERILPHTDFKAALLKGRGNYICLRKWRGVLPDAGALSPQERLAMIKILVWLGGTETGDISEHGGFYTHENRRFWETLASSSDSCLNRKCPWYSRCFVMRARREAARAHLVVVNHSLLFSDIMTDRRILPGHTRLIFDEAHNIENVASDYLGFEVSKWAILKVLDSLYESGPRWERGLLAQIGDMCGGEGEVWDIISKIQEIVGVVRDATSIFFEDFIRYIEERARRSYNRVRLRREDELWKDLSGELESMLIGLSDLSVVLQNLSFKLMGLPTEEARDYSEDVLLGLAAASGEIDSIVRAANFIASCDDEDFVYWVEVRGSDAYLKATPLNIDEALYDFIYSQMRSVIFSSATLTVNGTFDYMAQRLGLSLVEGDRVKYLAIGSPFYYEEQALLCVPMDIPLKKNDPTAFIDSVCDFLVGIAGAMRGRTMALFSNNADMNQVYSRIGAPLAQMGVELLAQNIDGSRMQITDQFRDNRNIMLLGTSSFWEGVDLPGEILECLVIVNLPFPVPTDPIVEARLERLRAAGRNDFQDYMIPNAVIKFKQGFGRLIRTKMDRGVVIVLDRRIISQSYGKQFINSLPEVGQYLGKGGRDVIARVQDWFSSSKLSPWPT